LAVQVIPQQSEPTIGSLSFPFLDLRAQYGAIRNELRAAVERVLESQQFILGAEGKQLEREIAALTECGFAVGCASGSDALALSMMALEIGPGDEVVTVPFTFGATAGAIARLGARPVFVDIEPETFNLDVDKLEEAISPQTKAIMPVHLFGLAAEMTPILEIAARHRLAVIEDAAQSIGARCGDRAVGSLGLFGCFSFFPSKNLGGAGDGGMVTTNDEQLAEKLRTLRSHGSRAKYHYEHVGLNSRLDELQAAILRVKLGYLQSWTEARRRHAQTYRDLFLEHGLEEVTLPAAPANRTHVYNQFVIRVPERDRLRAHLRSAAIPTELYYPSPLHLEPAFAGDYKPGDFPVAERACCEALALPIFPEMTESQQQSVVQAIAEYFRN
jgi:dTDP-4-amino-4,6-dideoxygalactose transaminase